MMAIFAVRYAVSAALAVSPALIHSTGLGALAGTAYGFLWVAFSSPAP